MWVMASNVAMIATFQLTPQMYRQIQVNKLQTQSQLHVKNPKNQMSQIPTQISRLRVKKTKSEVDP
jgi:Tfp pilus assembly protein FimV